MGTSNVLGRVRAGSLMDAAAPRIACNRKWPYKGECI